MKKNTLSTSIRLSNLEKIRNKMVYPYYENGEDAIFIGRITEIAPQLKINKNSIPEGTEYIMGFAHIPHRYFRDRKTTLN